MLRPGRRSETDRTWRRVAVGLSILLLLYYLVPLLSLLFAEPPGALFEALWSPRIRRAAMTSLLAASGSTVLSVLFGVPLAYWLSRQTGSVATAVTALVILPLVLPPVVSGVLLLTIVGPSTPLGGALAGVGVQVPGSIGGTVLAQTFVASPFVVITGQAAFAAVDRDLERASLSLGEGRAATFRRVTLPLAWPGVLAGIVLAFARSMGEFGATVMVSYYPQTLPVEIWDAFRAVGLEAALPVAILLVVVAAGTIGAVSALGTSPWQ
jgi:molybdate/tungstate transport system permease protein